VKFDHHLCAGTWVADPVIWAVYSGGAHGLQCPSVDPSDPSPVPRAVTNHEPCFQHDSWEDMVSAKRMSMYYSGARMRPPPG